MAAVPAPAGAEQVELLKNPDASRYEIHVGGVRAGLASYYRQGDVVVIPHTETSPPYGGRGYASRLVGFALADIRAQGLTVTPACPFVRDFIAKHPEHRDLVASL